VRLDRVTIYGELTFIFCYGARQLLNSGVLGGPAAKETSVSYTFCASSHLSSSVIVLLEVETSYSGGIVPFGMSSTAILSR
jgi:hypothetical protein